MDLRFAYMTVEMAATFPRLREAFLHWWELTDGALVRSFTSDYGEFATVALTTHDDICGVHTFRESSFDELYGIKSTLTFIRRGYRRQGIGQQLWLETVRWVQPESIRVYAASAAGFTFAKKLQRRAEAGALGSVRKLLVES